jgi:ribosomal 30S subunit maturation factor RimM
MREQIEVGYQVFVSDGGEELGAVRQVAPNGQPELVIYVENAGDFVVPFAAVKAVHFQKVILDCDKLEHRLRRAIGHAHDAEKPDA